jgi:hypothetical protein
MRRDLVVDRDMTVVILLENAGDARCEQPLLRARADGAFGQQAGGGRRAGGTGGGQRQ